MANTETKKTLSEFSRRALQSMKDKQKTIRFSLEVPSIEGEMEFRTLKDDEILECLQMEDNGDPNHSDKYCIYLASVNPSLRDTATELKEAGEITEYLQVMEMFPLREITGMATCIMEKSGVLGGKKVRVVEKGIDALKN